MKRIRDAIITLLAIMVLAIGTARGASTTNYTDQWWIQAESGWGASVLQQADTLFVCFFVYGTDNKPIWFVAVATYRPDSPAGHQLFTGELWVTTGPWYGGDFDPALRTDRVAGTFSFDADSGNTAMMAYTVDGTAVQKNVTRETWATQNLSGSYYGGDSGEQTFCGEDNGHWETQYYYEITHNADNSVTIKMTDSKNRVATATGTYSQSGHMGQVTGTVLAPDQFAGTFDFFEIERSPAGVTGRGHAVVGPVGGPGGCTWDGRWGGVRR